MQTTEIARIAIAMSRDTKAAIGPDDIEQAYPGLAEQTISRPIEPAVALLRKRRETNGYADLRDLAYACGVPVYDLPEMRAFALRCSAIPDVRVTPAMGSEPAQYRIAI